MQWSQGCHPQEIPNLVMLEATAVILMHVHDKIWNVLQSKLNRFHACAGDG
jgi:hypothetical protein